jgi:hypothetical protein
MNVAKMMSGEDAGGSVRLIDNLRASAKRGGKWLQLAHRARATVLALAVVFLTLIPLIYLVGEFRQFRHVLNWALISLPAAFAALLLAALGMQRWRRSSLAPQDRPAVTQILFDLLVLVVGWIPAKIDLAFFRPRFLNHGRLDPPHETAAGRDRG